MKAVPSIMKFHDGADPIQDYKHSLKKKSRDLKKEDELNGTVSEDIADKLYDSLIFKSNKHKPTVVSSRAITSLAISMSDAISATNL
jgi:hypothetical protein